MFQRLDDEIPPITSLLSPNELEREDAWEKACAVLWRRGRGVTNVRMSGAQHEDREDVISEAIIAFQQDVINGNVTGIPDPWEKFPQ
jgi:hypothetical protein